MRLAQLHLPSPQENAHAIKQMFAQFLAQVGARPPQNQTLAHLHARALKQEASTAKTLAETINRASMQTKLQARKNLHLLFKRLQRA